MRLLKYATMALAALVVLAVLAALALWMSFDPNDYKAQIQRKVREQTGRELSLPGKISLSVFPDIALEFGPALLGNAPGFGAEPMLQLQRVRLSVRLRPLFAKRLEVSGVEIIRPEILLQVDKTGRDNWTDIGEKFSGRTRTDAGNAGTPLDVRIAGLKIADGSLDYVDARTGSTTSVTRLNLTTGELAGNQVYRVNAPLLEMLVSGSGLPKGGVPLTLRSPSLDMDPAQQTLDWPGLQADLAGAKLEVAITGRRLFDEPQLSGTLALAELSPREWLPKFGIVLPVTSDAAVFSRFALSAGFAANSHRVTLSSIDAHLDESTLTGSAGITDLESMAMQFDLLVNRFNADRYLAPASPAVAAKRPAVAKPAPPVQMPVEMLLALNLRGAVRIAEATFAGVKFSGMRVGLEAARGRVHLAPLEAGLYGGQYRGDISIDATALPRISFNEQVTGVDFAPLAKDWLETNRLSGRGSLSVKASASGKDSSALLRTLTGKLALKVDNGAIEGIDLLHEIRRARALLKKQDLPVRSGAARTPFSQLGATAGILNGVFSTSDLVAATQVLRVNGKGSADLPAGRIDMRLDVTLLQSGLGETAADLADASGLVIPVQVSGALSDPTIRPDVGAMAKTVLQQKVDEKKKELEQKLREQLGDKLKDLFGR